MFALADAISAAIRNLAGKAAASNSARRTPAEQDRAKSSAQDAERFYSRYDLSWRDEDDLPFAR